MSEVEILHEGEVGPELEEYINSLLDRNRELTNTVLEYQELVREWRETAGMWREMWDEMRLAMALTAAPPTISEYLNTEHGGKI